MIARLREIVVNGTHSDSLRALETWISRVYGKPTEHLVTETSTDVEGMTLEQLERERAALVATLGPSHAEEGSVTHEHVH